MAAINAIQVETIPCPLCGSGEHRLIGKCHDYVYDVPGEYSFVECCQCRHLYLNPRPTTETLMLAYPSFYGPHRSASDSVDQTEEQLSANGKSSLRRLVKGIFKTIPGLRPFLNWLGQEQAIIMPTMPAAMSAAMPDGGPARLLEIGCAHGGYLMKAREAGWQVDGIEPSVTAASLARQQGFEVHVGGYETAELEPASREAIVSWMVLEHVVEPREMLRFVARTLVPGGQFVFSIPNASSPERIVFGRYWQGYDPPRHLHAFRIGTIRKLLIEVGFEDVRVTYQAGLRDWYASLGACWRERFPKQRLGPWLINVFLTEPPRWLFLISLLPAKLWGAMRCSGRVTIQARKLSRG